MKLVSEFFIVVMIAGTMRCVSSLEGVHAGSILSIKAGDRWLAVGASDNTMSLFHRPERQGGSRLPPWKLLRTPPRSAAVVCLSPKHFSNDSTEFFHFCA